MTTEPGAFERLSFVVFGAASGWGRRIHGIIAQSAPVDIIEIEASPEDKFNAIRKNQVVVLAIPDDKIDAELMEAESLLAPYGKSIIDCATNKAGFAQTLKRLAVSGASVCSTHPMVKSESSPRGQNCILMPAGNNSTHASETAQRIFDLMGMNIEVFHFKQHADAMVILQMVPHLVQRILIDALGRGLDEKTVRMTDSAIAMTVDDLSRVAPANYLLAELGLGRVAFQRPDVSAGIVATALQTRFGRKILGGMQETIGKIVSAGDDREQLTSLFQAGVTRLDEGGQWRAAMEAKTEAALIRLGNLRKRSFQVKVANTPGILNKILTVLDAHKIDMTALDSQVLVDAAGEATALFDIGITDERFNDETLREDLARLGVEVLRHRDE